jgi:hypothetical protein
MNSPLHGPRIFVRRNSMIDNYVAGAQIPQQCQRRIRNAAIYRGEERLELLLQLL